MKEQKSKKVEFSLDQIQNNPATKSQLKGFIEEVVLVQRQMKTAKESLKDIVDQAKESLGMPPKVLMKLAKENMDPGVIEAEVHELEEIQAVAEAMESTKP